MGSGNPSLSKPPVATIKVRNFRALREVLGLLGADPGPILQSVGLAANLFDAPDSTILYSDLDRLLSHAIRATGCRDLGLLVGVQQQITVTGLAGLASLHAPTVRDALGTLAAGLKLSDTGGVISFEISQGIAFFGYNVVARGIRNVEQLCDASIAIAVNAMRRFCGANWRPDRVYLTNDPPMDAERFARFFGAPIEYRAPQARIAFDPAVLDRHVEGNDVEQREILAPLFESAVQAGGDDFLSAAQSILRSRPIDGRLTRSDLSHALGVTTHVLTRRLKSAGFTFADLVERHRIENAQRWLLKGKRISEISVDLGFADTSSFTRAFKKWAGEPPKRWREQQFSSEPADNSPYNG